MTELSGWETVERVTESGASESRQRILADRPVVDASESGARWLGVRYWQAVQDTTRGTVRAGWRDEGGRLTLFGGATLLRFAAPELSAEDGVVSCRYAIEGGFLAVRAGGTVTLEQRPAAAGVELVVSVEEYLPRLAARVGAPRWTGLLYARAQSPFHVEVSRRHFESLARGSAP
jgi:hypothetical protein